MRPGALAFVALGSIAFSALVAAHQQPTGTAPRGELTRCAATLEAWRESPTWPSEKLLIGDHVYSRAELEALASESEPISRLAAQMAAAQLNLEAGAPAEGAVIEALFSADELIGSHQLDSGAISPESQSARSDTSLATTLAGTLSAYNDWAAAQPANCATPPPATVSAL